LKTEIYSGVTMPANKAGAPQKYPFDRMKPGDHFLWSCKPGEDVKIKRSSISTTARQRGYKVVTRMDGNLIRCWMVGSVSGGDNGRW